MASQQRGNLITLLIGAAATAASCIAYRAGWLDWLEYRALDLRFRHPLINRIPVSGQITCVDISDRSLELIGRWPWPRDVQAGLISLIAELGARALLVDITYVEAEPLRTIPPNDADLAVDPLELGPEDVRSAYPDYELRAAIHAAGNVYLAYHHPPYDEREFSELSHVPRLDVEHSLEFQRAVDAFLREDPAAALEALRPLEQRLASVQRRLAGRHRTLAATGEALLAERARMVARMQQRGVWDEDAVLASFGEADERTRLLLRDAFQRAQEAALRRVAQRWIEEDPARPGAAPASLFRALYAQLSERPFENETPLKRSLALALRDVLGVRSTTADSRRASPAALDLARPVDGIAPVYFLHAAAARRCGFVNFVPERDGVVRRMWLLRRHGQTLLTQLALALGCDLLDAEVDETASRPGRLTLRLPSGERRRIQLDALGRMLVPWIPAGRFVPQFAHVDAADLWTAWEHRRLAERNRALSMNLLYYILEDELLIDCVDERDELRNWARARDAAQRARYLLDHAGHEARRADMERIEARLLARAGALREFFERQRATLEAGPSTVSAERRQQIATRAAAFQTIEDAQDANPRLLAVAQDALNRVRPRIEGKVCLLGYTATSLADMVPTPTSARAPGVLAHANLLNGLITGRLVSWWPAWANLLLAAGMGLASSAIGVWRRPREAAVLVPLLALGLVVLFGWLPFYLWTCWIALVPALAALATSYVAIAVYRYIFVDRERRELATALGQYTSKQIARLVAEDAELCRRAEMREVTAMFTDLRGFTSISERIGAERTQRVLNVCLGRFTDVILRHEGMVNKFMGDGVFAFWNPVIYPQADHARRACEAALELLRALDGLRRRGDGGLTDEVLAELVIRIGIATGNAVVGPCGSEQKYDYTCIGDSVNVAARLESGNKFYGTSILVAEATCAQAGPGFVFRALGGVQVKGKQQAVPIFELLGREGDVNAEDVAYAAQFGAAVRLYQQQYWREALAAFEDCLGLRPGDLAAQRYAQACAVYRDHPPGEPWSGALELVEK